jgi:hypothetical protein
VISADTAITHTTERKTLIGKIPGCFINAATTKRSVLDPLLLFVTAAGKQIKSQGIGICFTIFIASSVVLNVMIGNTGPKISSVITGESRETAFYQRGFDPAFTAVMLSTI